MTGTLERSLKILEFLAAFPEGAPLATIAAGVQIPNSACHRLLTELARCGFVKQVRGFGEYELTTKLAAIGLSHLTNTGIVDIAQPIIDEVAQLSGELVRLSVVDGERLTFVAKAQGARYGLRYDPDMGMDVKLSCSAAGHAWLMTLPEDRAIEAVTRQGMGKPSQFGPNAPTSIKALLKMLREHRKRGYSVIRDGYAPGMSSMAAPVRRRDQQTSGVVVIAGPSFRLTEKRVQQFGPRLLATAAEMASTGDASPLLKAANVGTWGNQSR